MSSLDDYRTIQRHVDEAARWAEMLGARYEGGGGGTGSIVSLGVTPTLYFQAYNGSTNYHKAPDALADWLSKEIRKDFPRLLALAQAAMAEEAKKLADHARKEHAQLMKDAGLEVPA